MELYRKSNANQPAVDENFMHELAVKNFNDLAIHEFQIEKKFQALRSRNGKFSVVPGALSRGGSLSKEYDVLGNKTP